MTQIIAVLTQEYVLVASDRRLTNVSGPLKGETADDNTCKLVSLCGTWGIAYTGFSKLQDMHTHEWIATQLAEKGCENPYSAAKILTEAAGPAFRAAPFPLELTFLMAGWARLPDGQSLQPHFLLISNVYHGHGKKLPAPGPNFQCWERRLSSNELYVSRVVGEPLPKGRGRYLHRYLRPIFEHKSGPKLVMEAFVKEIVNTSKSLSSVGDKILAFSIPKVAAKQMYKTGENLMLAAEPDLVSSAFCYFDPEQSISIQYGPTYVCGEWAMTAVETESDPERDSQSMSVKILHSPRSGQT